MRICCGRPTSCFICRFESKVTSGKTMCVARILQGILQKKFYENNRHYIFIQT